ncbi:MAG TPA: LytTR family DNA-binding domain-containing protein [Prolixibacteraceae bacterium]|nr:LytTR family DNA-binding domain-containing protein [Prolixibacteraceae bacterium]
MKILIIEDEQPQAFRLAKCLSEIDDTIIVKDIIPSVSQSVEYLKNHPVDLIFLDIHLSDGLCFGIFEKVTIECPVIFTTAYDQYAIEAFKHNGIDYLLKPIMKEDVQKSITKFQSLTGYSNDYKRILATLEAFEKFQNVKHRFVCQLGRKLKIVTDSEIAYFYACEGSVFIRTHKNENLLFDDTLENVEKKLDSYHFFRLNRKMIAHISSIKEMLPYSKSRLKINLIPEFSDDVIVSYQNIRSFMKWIKK